MIHDELIIVSSLTIETKTESKISTKYNEFECCATYKNLFSI